MRNALFLLLVLGLSNASLVWQYSTDGAVSVKPVIYQGALVIASDDGNVYGLDPSTGVRRWQTAVGKAPNELLLADNAIYLSTSGGKIAKLGLNGVKEWEVNLNVTDYNVTRIFGSSVNAKEIFVTANNGVYLIQKDGSVGSRLAFFNNTVLSPPESGGDFVIYGKGGELIRQSDAGTVMWRSSLPEGSFWLSRPTIEGNIIYVGALDDKMHAFFLTNGVELWGTRTRNWVVSTPLVKSGMVYFGSNDGNVYAVDAGDGNVRWSAQTQLAAGR
jgi:outer membrane protein assembly factor BamB